MNNFGLIHLDISDVNQIIPKDYIFLGTLVDGIAWTNGISDINEKINFLNNNKNYAVDINVGDRINKKDVYQLRNIELTKILTDTECEYCAISNNFANIDRFRKHFNQDYQHKGLIFTSSRCGSNLLRSSLFGNFKIDHHDSNFEEMIQYLSEYKTIFTVFRKDFVELVTSVAIAKQYGTIVTKKHNFDKMQEKIKSIEPFLLHYEDIEETLKSFINFCDILIYASLLRDNIYYIMYEDLVKIHKSNFFFKNSYDKRIVIDNFEDLPEICYNDIAIYNKTMFKSLSRLNHISKENLK